MKIKWFQYKDPYVWRKWFAWYPVLLCNDNVRTLVWLQNVERCRDEYTYDYDYRLIKTEVE